MSTVVKPYTFSASTTASSSQVNANFDTIYNDYNGGIDSSNIATSGVATANIANNAVTTAKINDDAVTSAKIDYGGAGTGTWWEEIGRTTLGSAGDTISVTSLPARKYLRVFAHTLDNGSATQTTVRFNNDSAANYATRFSINGAADSTSTSATSIIASQSSAEEKFTVMDVVNVATALKFVSGVSSEEGGATVATTPDRLEYVAKWGNITDQITRVDVINSGAGDFAIGSEVIILGHN